MNKNDTEKLVIFAAALRLSFDACSVKALIHYYGGRFIFVAQINRVTSNGNAPSCSIIAGVHLCQTTSFAYVNFSIYYPSYKSFL